MSLEPAVFHILPIGVRSDDGREVVDVPKPTEDMAVYSEDGEVIGIIDWWGLLGDWLVGMGTLDADWFGSGVEAEIAPLDHAEYDDETDTFKLSGPLRKVQLGMNPTYKDAVVMPA